MWHAFNKAYPDGSKRKVAKKNKGKNHRERPA